MYHFNQKAVHPETAPAAPTLVRIWKIVLSRSRIAIFFFNLSNKSVDSVKSLSRSS